MGKKETKSGKQRKTLFIVLIAIVFISAAAVVTYLKVEGLHDDISPSDGISAYEYGTNRKISSKETTLETGDLYGKGIMFYLGGKDISTVLYSCKNQTIQFKDWTDKREAFSSSQNFTVVYGEKSEDYSKLVINWVPDDTTRALTDHSYTSIATLPDKLREDTIVMEIAFANGESATKAIKIKLLDNEKFAVSFVDYNMEEEEPHDKQEEESQYNMMQEETQNETKNQGVSTEKLEQIVKAYYEKTVFKVIEMKCEKNTKREVVFSVKVSKDGVVQEPNRTITLQPENYMRPEDEDWKVTNEGY